MLLANTAYGVRRATADDAGHMAAVIAAVAEERLWLSTRAPDDVLARAERLRAGLTSGRVISFVATRGRDVVGELSLFLARDVISLGMCLLPDARGRGLGGALLDAALVHAVDAGWPVVALRVYEHNVAARGLYRSRGFVAVGAAEIDDLRDGRVYQAIRMQRLSAGAERQAVILHVAEAVIAKQQVRRIAVDGTDGAGKTCFAAELAHALEWLGRSVVRASVDEFHNPRAVRYRQGRTSATGFYEDSYDYGALRHWLLDPFGPGGSGHYRRAVHDVATDRQVEAADEYASPEALLVVDGIFLQRDELSAIWDYAIFLDVDVEISIPRGAVRGMGSADVASETNRRYIDGQRLYFERADPRQRASIVIDNNDLAHPRISHEAT